MPHPEQPYGPLFLHFVVLYVGNIEITNLLGCCISHMASDRAYYSRFPQRLALDLPKRACGRASDPLDLRDHRGILLLP